MRRARGRWTWVASAVAGLGAVLCLVQCGENGAWRPASVAQPPAGAVLAIETHLPAGESPPRSSVDAIFDRPMVRLGEAAPKFEAGRKLLALEPQPPGTYAWIGTRTLSFTATGGLPVATAFRARVPAGIAALDGTRLPQDVVWEFTTPRPQLVASVPAAGDSLVRVGDPFVLAFNVGVEPGAVAQAASLAGVSRWTASRPDSNLLRELDGRFWEVPEANRVALVPEPPLQRDTAYELVLGAALRAAVGTLGPESEVRIPFRTYPPPALLGVHAGGTSVVRLHFRTPVDADSASAYVTFQPAVPLASGWTNGSVVYLGGEFGVEKTYAVHLRAGLPDLFGQRLPEPLDLTFTTGARSPVLQLLPEDAVLLPATSRDVAVVAASMQPVRLRARPLAVREEIRNRNEQGNARARWTIERTLGGGKQGTYLQTTVDLRAALPPGGLGAVLVEASALPATGGGGEWRVRSVLRWSDLGLSLKASAESGIAWTTQLRTAKPRPGVQLQVLDHEGRVLWTGKSDARGMAQLPGTRALGRDLWQLSLVGASGADTATASFMADWRVSPWQFDIPGVYGMEPADERAFLYGDRDIYRPGETAHVAGLVRRTTGAGLQAAGVDSVEMLVRDPLGREFLRRDVALDAGGGFALDIETTRKAALGRYWIEAAVRTVQAGKPPKVERQTIGSLGIQLAAYRAAAFRTSVRGSRRQLFPGETLEARVGGEYFFGSPLAGAAFTWNVIRERFDFAPRGFEGYAFDDPELELSHGGMLGSGRAALGDSGTASLRLPLPPDLPPVPQALHVEATVRDAAGDEVAGRTTLVYHPTPVYAGVMVEPRFVAPGDTITARLVAVRADTAIASTGTPLELVLVRREWRTVRKLLVGGRVGYETATVDSLVETRTVMAGAEPSIERLCPSEPGHYRLRLQVKSEKPAQPVAVTTFYVAGARAGAWRSEDAIRLELTPDRAAYAPGDTARILVTTPVRATRAWLTVEREGVLASRLLELRDGAQVLEVPVLDAYLPNVYVGLSAVEPALSKQAAPSLPEPARLPRFVMGYAPLRVQVDARRLAVALHPERDSYRPGERARIDLEVRDASGTGVASRVGVAVVDEAVLALLGSAVPDPFGFFYQERPLAVSSGDTRLRLSAGARLEAARFKAEAGGDGAERLAARSLFTTTAYWNPAVATDAEGKARVEFVLPDNLTRFRVVAIAASGVDRFGSATGGFRVAKPLTVDPALPRFVLPGDTLDLAAVVTNRTGASAAGTVRASTDLQLLAKGETGVQLGAGESKRVAFRAVAEREGAARVRFEARLALETDAVEMTLAVPSARLPQVAATAARVTERTREEVALPASALPGSATLEVALAPSALGGARPAYDYVVEYPYYCVEQLASRLLVLVTARDLFATTPAEAARDSEKIADTIGKLESLCLPWEGFSFWSGGPAAPQWLTAYAALALGRAESAGWEISEEVLQTASAACVRPWRTGPPSRSPRRRAGQMGEDATWWLQLPAGLALLALSENVRPGPESALRAADVDLLADHAEDLAPDQQLALALALHRWGMHAPVVERVLRRALERAEVTSGGAVIPAFDAGDLPLPFRTTVRATSLALWLGATVHPEEPLVSRLATGLLASRASGHWRTTQDDALALLALAAYRDGVERQGGPVSATAQLGEAAAPLVALEARAGDAVRRSATVALPLPGPSAATAAVDFATRGPLHYAAVLRWQEDARRQGSRETGFTLARRVDRFEGQGPVRLGDLVVVTLTVVVPRVSWYLSIVDPLPAGLEIVQTEFAVESRRVAAVLAAWHDEHPALPVVHMERDDRELRLFTDEVPAGVYVHRYVARVRAAGGFAHLPARVAGMYTPELSGSTASGRWRALGPASEKRR